MWCWSHICGVSALPVSLYPLAIGYIRQADMTIFGSSTYTIFIYMHIYHCFSS